MTLNHALATRSNERFGPFRVYEKLGVGGTASVFRAQLDLEDGRTLNVSLKRLHPHLASDLGARDAFVQEARIARLLIHDNISRFYQMGRLGNQYFIATEFIKGTDLMQLMRSMQRPCISAVLSLLVQLCSALQYAHTRVDHRTGEELGFVHRDISPSNLLVTEQGQLKLIDMGIAKSRASTIRTDTGMIKGTRGYLAPEVLAGELPDQRADIFAVGVVAWELVAAVRLFGGGSDAEVMDRIRLGAEHPPSALNMACPRALDVIIMRALAMQPSARWSSARELKTALEAVASALNLPLSRDAVASWLDGPAVESLAPPADRTRSRDTLIPISTATPTATRSSAFEPTTRVISRSEQALPTAAGELARGTGQLPLAAPPLTAERRSRAPGPATEAVMARDLRRRPALLVTWLLGASICLNMALLANLIVTSPSVAQDDRTRSLAELSKDTPTVNGAEEPKLDAAQTDHVAAPLALAARTSSSTAQPRWPPWSPRSLASTTAEGPAPAAPSLVERARLQRRYGRHPRSRSTTATYVARLCLDPRGRVTSVEILDGPARLHRRIRRALRRWRYRPYRPYAADGHSPRPVCFELREHLRRR